MADVTAKLPHVTRKQFFSALDVMTELHQLVKNKGQYQNISLQDCYYRNSSYRDWRTYPLGPDSFQGTKTFHRALAQAAEILGLKSGRLVDSNIKDGSVIVIGYNNSHSPIFLNNPNEIIAVVYDNAIWAGDKAVNKLYENLVNTYRDKWSFLEYVERAQETPRERLFELSSALNAFHSQLLTVGVLAGTTPIESNYRIMLSRGNLGEYGLPNVAVWSRPDSFYQLLLPHTVVHRDTRDRNCPSNEVPPDSLAFKQALQSEFHDRVSYAFERFYTAHHIEDRTFFGETLVAPNDLLPALCEFLKKMDLHKRQSGRL